jgi:hypothetical protein
MATTVVTGTSIKVNGAVNAIGSVGVNTTGAVFYTAPAGGYAIINVTTTIVGGGNALDVLVGGRLVYRTSGGAITAPFTTNTATNSAGTITVYVGPSQGVQLKSGSLTSGSAEISGVEFINSP